MSSHFNFKSSALVLIAQSHNPTVMDVHFLLKSKMIAEEEIVLPGKKVNTPAVSIIELIDGTTIQLDPDRLLIRAKNLSESPYKMAQLYCSSLTHIKAKGLGFNHEIEIEDVDSVEWFKKKNVGDLYCNRIVYQKNTNGGVPITIAINHNNSKIRVESNFHYDISGKTLGELEMDFTQMALTNDSILSENLNLLFNL